MSRVIVRADGAYLDPFGDGRLFRIDGVIVIDAKTGDTSVLIPAAKVTIEAKVEPLAAYDLSDDALARLVVNLAIMTQADLDKIKPPKVPK